MKNKTVSKSIWPEVVICPRALAIVSRWNNLLEEISEQLHSSKALLQLWRRYKDYSTQCASTVQQQADRTNELLKAATNKDIADDEVAAWIQDCNVCSETIMFLPTCLPLNFSSLAGLVLMWLNFWCVSVCEIITPKILVLSVKDPARFSEHMYQI